MEMTVRATMEMKTTCQDQALSTIKLSRNSNHLIKISTLNIHIKNNMNLMTRLGNSLKPKLLKMILSKQLITKIITVNTHLLYAVDS